MMKEREMGIYAAGLAVTLSTIGAVISVVPHTIRTLAYLALAEACRWPMLTASTVFLFIPLAILFALC